MIRMVTVVNNRRTAFIGLSRLNTERLHAGQPIRIDWPVLAMDGPIQEVVLLAGETEQVMLTEMEAVMPNQFAEARRDGRFHDLTGQ